MLPTNNEESNESVKNTADELEGLEALQNVLDGDATDYELESQDPLAFLDMLERQHESVTAALKELQDLLDSLESQEGSQN
ncbi:MAG: hypothetical protein LBT59_30735 [Clostridiales bacterium]|nr:hypothetical protein [Clostridiales bacterium]